MSTSPKERGWQHLRTTFQKSTSSRARRAQCNGRKIFYGLATSSTIKGGKRLHYTMHHRGSYPHLCYNHPADICWDIKYLLILFFIPKFTSRSHLPVQSTDGNTLALACRHRFSHAPAVVASPTCAPSSLLPPPPPPS